MGLTPRERNKLLVAMTGEVGRKRLSHSVKVKFAEAVALVTDFVVEGTRDGRSLA